MTASELALGCVGAGFDGAYRCPWGPSTDELGSGSGRALGLSDGGTVSCVLIACLFTSVLFRLKRLQG